MATLRNFTLVAVLAVFAFAIISDAAPKLARHRRATDKIFYNRDTAFRKQKEEQRWIKHFQSIPRANYVTLPRSPIVSEPTDSRVVFPSDTEDVDDHDDQIVTGANSIEGIIQEDFAPGVIYSGNPRVDAFGDEDDSGENSTEFNLVLEDAVAESRCIFCNPGQCPSCHLVDQEGVCRQMYGCGEWDVVTIVVDHLYKYVQQQRLAMNSSLDDIHSTFADLQTPLADLPALVERRRQETILKRIEFRRKQTAGGRRRRKNQNQKLQSLLSNRTM